MKVSVIIPCFNDGIYLTAAIGSVKVYHNTIAEIIIVNDGSTDVRTLSLLQQFADEGINVIHQPNSGLARARNNGILKAFGEYILPLDADNAVKPGYIEQSIKLLDSDVCDVVYAKPEFIGENIPERKFYTHEFNGVHLLKYNYIDACAIYRKSVWDSIGGYDELMPFQGYEDWEFWVNCFFNKFRFKFLDEELFQYNIRPVSMISDFSQQKFEANNDYILLKHKSSLLDVLLAMDNYRLFWDKDQQNFFRTSAKYFFKAVKNLVKN